MCGILAALGLTGDVETNRRMMLRLSKLLRHRGPDSNMIDIIEENGVYMCHERLNIVDISDAGRQPFRMDTEDGKGEIMWMVNGEIYNHENLLENQLEGHSIASHSDCAVVGPLYEKYGFEALCPMLDGMFAGVLTDTRTGEFYAARDHMGIASMYYGKAEDGSVWFSSEMKGLQHNCVEYGQFPPGHYYSSKTGEFHKYNNPVWHDMDYIPTAPADLTLLRETFIESVVKRLMTDAPLGILLSGGLDSSLVASVAVRHLEQASNSIMKGERLKTFSIGLEGSPDLAAAQKVADFLGTDHYNFTFTVEEGLDALEDLIWHLESYEQCRAAVPMYLLSRRIKALGIKVVLSGEGADEAFGGYLYFHKAPSAEEFHKECVRKTTRLHEWDVLRANKATFAFGLEGRVPFLDKKFLNIAMTMDASEKMCDMKDKPDGIHPRLEKYVIRKAFDVPENPYLPDDVLWRQKEQFSDGVGYSWVDGLKDYADKVVTDEMWEKREERFPEFTPRNKEYYLLRSIFEKHYPGRPALHTVPQGLSIACSTPEAVAWDPTWENAHEISGRAINIHESSDDFDFDSVDMDGASPPPSAAGQVATQAASVSSAMAKAFFNANSSSRPRSLRPFTQRGTLHRPAQRSARVARRAAPAAAGASGIAVLRV